MLQFGRSGGLMKAAIAGLGAWAYYKYSKMSPDQKRDLVNGLKEKGKKIFGQFMPAGSTQTNTSSQV
ncbi:MAG TPA: hypothetical protein VJT83_04445 [Chitinophagaceae bacterium]|nr:hypothetical protein [Chitinophagaceae bacterium]